MRDEIKAASRFFEGIREDEMIVSECRWCGFKMHVEYSDALGEFQYLCPNVACLCREQPIGADALAKILFTKLRETNLIKMDEL